MLPGAVGVTGSIKTMSVADLLDWIDRRELKGTVTLSHGQVTRRLRIAWGCVAGTESDNPAEYLAQLLLNAGAVGEEQLRGTFDERGELSLGKALVERGLVGEPALRAALETKIRESVYDALSWEDGTFAFDPEAGAPPGAEVEMALPLGDLVHSGKARADAWRILHALIPTDQARFWIADAGAMEALAPDSPDAAMLRCVAANMTVREIVLEQHSLPYPVYERLADLICAGTIKIDRRRTPRAPKVEGAQDDLVAAARGRAAGGDRIGAHALVKRALAAAPGDESVRTAYQEIERALFAELSRALLKKFRVPRLAKKPEELDTLELSAEERYFVGRIDGRWDLLSLMRVSPLREVEALITIQQLAQRGVITLE
jgi:hypothetical protein